MTAPELPVTVTPLAAILQRGRWRLTDLHADPHPALYVFTRGQGRVFVDGKTRGLTSPCYLYIPARATTRFAFPVQVFGTKLTLAPEIAEALPATAFLVRSPTGAVQADLAWMLARIEAEGRSGTEDVAAALTACGTLLALEIARLHRQDGAPVWAVSKSERLVAEFMGLIEDDLGTRPETQPSVAGYAERLGITPTHLTRVCQSVAGVGASALLQDRLLSEARWRLADTPNPVHQIADALGYGSAAYFARSYGARMGHPPSADRQALRRG
ncbi:MAG: AraC family transcriptional regulator [Pseudomonadota bacterium]